ncbi:MAG: hypothetical protein ABI690_36700, partial [Chloroflexota bacterium]
LRQYLVNLCLDFGFNFGHVVFSVPVGHISLHRLMILTFCRDEARLVRRNFTVNLHKHTGGRVQEAAHDTVA